MRTLLPAISHFGTLEHPLLTNVLIARYTFSAYGVGIVPVIVAVTLLNRERAFYIYTGIWRDRCQVREEHQTTMSPSLWRLLAINLLLRWLLGGGRYSSDGGRVGKEWRCGGWV